MPSLNITDLIFVFVKNMEIIYEMNQQLKSLGQEKKLGNNRYAIIIFEIK